jgi:hypothetical protein
VSQKQKEIDESLAKIKSGITEIIKEKEEIEH